MLEIYKALVNDGSLIGKQLKGYLVCDKKDDRPCIQDERDCKVTYHNICEDTLSKYTGKIDELGNRNLSE